VQVLKGKPVYAF